MSKTEASLEENVQEPSDLQKDTSFHAHVPRPSSCCIAVTVLSIVVFASMAALASVWDDSKTFKHWIDAEFFVTHFVYFPIMRLLTRNAVFCGSNGLWQTDILQGTSFDPRMQTEDIDVSVRMLLERHCIDFCPEARSGELAPVSLRALLKQRLRWAIGWDEVSLKLWKKMPTSEAQGQRKVAVSYICWSRWFMQIIGIIAGIATPILGFVQRLDPNFCHCGMATQLLQTALFYFYIILMLSCTLEAIFQTHHRGCQSWIQVLFVGIFMGMGFFYIIFQALLIVISLFKIATGTVGGWVVTARKAQISRTKTETARAVDEEAPPSCDLKDLEAPPSGDLKDLDAEQTSITQVPDDSLDHVQQVVL